LLEKVSGAEEQFTSIFEDQALLAKLFLAAPAVISGSRTSRYRQHDRSATARAQRVGVYAPDRPNRSRDEFLQWLRTVVQGQPDVADDELRDALSDALKAYERRNRLRLAKAKLHLRAVLSPDVRRMLQRIDRKVHGGVLARVAFPRRLEPLSRVFGYDRGFPVDRYYIERFLGEHAHLIAGRVLEVGDAHYTHQFGGDKVTRSDVLNVLPDIPGTTFVDDLSDARSLPSEAFDCVVLTQTLHLIYDMAAAVETLHRILRPGGAVLATVPGISPVDQGDWRGTWYWALTPLSAHRLFSDVFGDAHIETTSYGNLVTSIAFLQGMAAHELSARELSVRDPQFPMLITIKAARPAGG
jgi:SAM-dependent methyltransferase